MKPIHAVVAGVLVLVWIGVLAFVLTHGKDQGSAVDVYSELPPGFTAALQTKGVTFTGLSPVDGATVEQVLAHATADVAAASGADPIVLRTAFSDSVQGCELPGPGGPDGGRPPVAGIQSDRSTSPSSTPRRTPR